MNGETTYGSVPAIELEARARSSPLCAFTVDVEDWYQSCVDFDAPITERVVRNVDRVLDLLASCGSKGTFFVQGRVAETYPALVRELVEGGHEVQSHGYSHRPLDRMNRGELVDELARARATVEDAAGVRVTAFRAPDFSIGASNLWALDELERAGFLVDSSIFPMRTRRYGIDGWPLSPHFRPLANGERILEVPVAVWEVGSRRVPVCGGGYFRLTPLPVLERGLRSITAAGRPAVVYCHPYEFSVNELRDYRRKIPWHRRLQQGVGRGKAVRRFRGLLTSMPFGRFDETLASWNLQANVLAMSAVDRLPLEELVVQLLEQPALQTLGILVVPASWRTTFRRWVAHRSIREPEESGTTVCPFPAYSTISS